MSHSRAAVGDPALLTKDAQNRAFRTLIQNLVVDAAVALILVLVAAFNDAEAWGDFEWSLLAFTLAKTLVVTAGSFVMRQFLDPMRGFPTPLPPAPQPKPADAVPPGSIQETEG